MNGDVTREHYTRLAITYDENWAYSPAFLEWMTGCIMRRLRLTSGDVAADIGCGTGLYARGLAEYAAAVVCVDASEAMLAQVPADERLITVAARVSRMWRLGVLTCPMSVLTRCSSRRCCITLKTAPR